MSREKNRNYRWISPILKKFMIYTQFVIEP